MVCIKAKQKNVSGCFRTHGHKLTVSSKFLGCGMGGLDPPLCCPQPWLHHGALRGRNGSCGLAREGWGQPRATQFLPPPAAGVPQGSCRAARSI